MRVVHTLVSSIQGSRTGECLTTLAQKLDLGPDQFAFHFDTGGGVGAEALATLLQRAATIARRQGGELRVIGLSEGSLSVIIEAIKKSKLAKNAQKEYLDKPIEKTIAISSFTAGIVWAIIHAMSPEQSGDTPINKSAADIIEKCEVTQISVVTIDSQTVVMNAKIAGSVRQVEAERRMRSSLPVQEGNEDSLPVKQLDHPPSDMSVVREQARGGRLIGRVVIADGDLFFGPSEYRFLVPIDIVTSKNPHELVPGRLYQIIGEIIFESGQPDSIVIESARPIID